MSAPFIFANLIPKEYKPLLTAISPAAFSVVDWKQFLKDAPTLVGRFTNNQGVENLSKTLAPLWPIDHQQPTDVGPAALELYFAQIMNPHGLFLDLRLKNFSKGENQSVSYLPNGFWIQWQEPFRLGLFNIYTGYYENQPDLLEKDLAQVGLIHNEMPQEKIAEVKDMLLSHIGGDYKQQRFLISDFTASFERFFKFLLTNKIRLSVDFLYLGIYLASLYHCLQEVGGVYNVQQAFQKAKGKSKSTGGMS